MPLIGNITLMPLAPSGNGGVTFMNKWSLMHIITGLLSGGLAINLNNPIRGLIAFNIIHFLCEWNGFFHRQETENYNNLILNSFFDSAYFLIGSIIALLIMYKQIRTQKSYQLYLSSLAPILFCLLMICFLKKFNDSSMYSGIDRYGNNQYSMKLISFFLIATVSFYILQNVNTDKSNLQL